MTVTLVLCEFFHSVNLRGQKNSVSCISLCDEPSFHFCVTFCPNEGLH